MRIGLSGPSGAGKSTFIEAFGTMLTGMGHKVAVLAVDPSSRRTGGSILGDKTRMETLARDPNAFIRPSPSGGTLGGVARRTREAMLLVEAAGFDVVIVETVGVGQSETAVADMADLFALIVSPGGGDELQGMKRGIMELADLVVVNKADGDLLPAANRAAADVQGGLHFLRPKFKSWTPPVALVSALERKGLDAVWDHVRAFRAALTGSGEWEARRRVQVAAWFEAELIAGLEARLKAEAHGAIAAAARDVATGRETPPAAARRIIASFWGKGA